VSDVSFESDLTRRLAVARGHEPADLVIKGGRVLSVFTGELLDADVAIAGEHVAAVGPGYEGQETFDGTGLTILTEADGIQQLVERLEELSEETAWDA